MVIRVKMKFVEFVKFVVAINKRGWSLASFFYMHYVHFS